LKKEEKTMRICRRFFLALSIVFSLLLFIQNGTRGSSLDNWYPGEPHVHSTYSDGAIGIVRIAKVAKQRGLKWVIVTDHDVDLRDPGKQKGKDPSSVWQTAQKECKAIEKEMAEKGMPVLIIYGEELGWYINNRDRITCFGHYLAYDIPGHIHIDYEKYKSKNIPYNQDIIDAVKEVGGFGFIAHPYSITVPTRNYSDWDDWNAIGYTGIEMMSHARTWPGASYKYTAPH
jgi:hypothetical protein